MMGYVDLLRPSLVRHWGWIQFPVYPHCPPTHSVGNVVVLIVGAVDVRRFAATRDLTYRRIGVLQNPAQRTQHPSLRLLQTSEVLSMQVLHCLSGHPVTPTQASQPPGTSPGTPFAAETDGRSAAAVALLQHFEAEAVAVDSEDDASDEEQDEEPVTKIRKRRENIDWGEPIKLVATFEEMSPAMKTVAETECGAKHWHLMHMSLGLRSCRWAAFGRSRPLHSENREV